MNTLKILLAGAMALVATLAHAAFGNLSDAWHDPSDPGWGLNIVQQGDTAVVTLMVYASGGEPVWYIASPARAYAWSGDGMPHLRGTLYRTHRKSAGVDRDVAAAVQAMPVGELYVSPIDRGRARLDYTVDGLAAARTIERATWSLPATGATWMNTLSLRVTGDDKVVVQETTNGRATLSIEDGVATLTLISPEARCEYRGAYRQTGRTGDFAGEFSCGDLRTGQFRIDDLELTTHGISGRLRATWRGASAAGTFGGPQR